MIVEIGGKRIKAEGDVLVRYTDGSSEVFAVERIDILYINKSAIQSLYILKKDK